MKKLFYFSAAFLSCQLLLAQGVKGYVKDAVTNLPLTGAFITVDEGSQGAISLEDGSYFLPLPQESSYLVKVRFIGYKTEDRLINYKGGTQMVDFYLTEGSEELKEVNISALRAKEKTPIAYQNVAKETIEERNLGQDIPFILDQTVSAVSTSDAGANIGYTGLRIRGSDQTRINVTINGIPLNDAESQGVFWVNTPDFASSLQSVQIQRGAGTSTNGSGAFGATLNLETADLQKKPFAQVHIGAGSFNTERYTLQVGTGLINKHWAFQGRLSQIRSDGYLDRARSNLRSYFFTGGYVSDKTTVKAVVFGGNEETYQAWNGVDSLTFENDPTFNSTGAIYDTLGNITGFYDNQVDNYTQTHYQLHLNHRFTSGFKANLSLHYTRGSGYFEEYRSNDLLANYGITNTPETNSDLVRRLWLDNDFYGFIYNLDYTLGSFNFILGGGANEYRGDHFGEVVWARFAGNQEPFGRFYFSDGFKRDINTYFKTYYNLTPDIQFFADLQYRYVSVNGDGDNENQTIIDFEDTFNFFNPKFGISARLNKRALIYASYSIAQREPSRRDYIGTDVKPEEERLGDLEVGSRLFFNKALININAYYMHYSNQLVLTGQVDNVGAFLRSNVGNSYRLGLEVDAQVELTEKLRWAPNIAISQNEIIDYKEETDEGIEELGNTPIAFSPNVIGGSTLSWEAFKGFEAALINKFVGKQFLNNSGLDRLTLPSYFLTDIRVSYNMPQKLLKNIRLEAGVFNLLNEKYASNGYVFDGSPFYYPQAGTNFLGGIKIDF